MLRKIRQWIVGIIRSAPGPTNKFGFQCQFDSGDAERYNRELKPTAVMMINVTKRSFLERLKADNPGVRLIYRHYPEYNWQHPTPEQAARQAVGELQAEIGHLLDLLDYVTDNNEYILGPDHMATEDIQKGDRYMAEFIGEARRVLGLGTCWLNANTGHWGAETVNYFPKALTAAEADGDSPICFHEYNWPKIRDDGHWTCGKVLRAMPPIRAKYDVPGMITEFGVDSGVAVPGEHKGWRGVHEDFDTAASIFCGSDGIQWYKQEVVKQAPWLKAVLVFGCGMVSPWESFDVAPIIDKIKQALEVEPGNGGNSMSLEDIKVFKLNPAGTGHIELTTLADKEALVYDKYGAAFRRANVASGQKVYRLIELWEKTGTSSLITNVVNEAGQPIQDLPVTFYWPDAPDPPEPPTTVYAHDWYRRFVWGKTNVNGDVGPGMGHGAYHGVGEGGPHAVWVHDPNIPSDICEKLGMLAGTFHDHLDQKFQLVTESDGNGNGDGEEQFQLAGVPVFEGGTSNRIVIEIAPDQERDFYETRADVCVTDEAGETIYWESPSPIMPASLTKYECGAEYVPQPGETHRFFFIGIRDWADANKKRIGWIGPFRYETGQKGTWKAQVVWGEEESPADGDLEERVEALEEGLADLRAKVKAAFEAAADLL